MEKAAILFMGPPGTGKGTQTFKVTERFPNFTHFDTGGEIYRKVTDPRFATDSVVQKQKEIYFAGILNDPQWVSELVAERIKTYAKQDRGVVFSGSPRTLHEAKTIIPTLFDAYGKDRVLTFILEVSKETAKKRSLGRISCSNKKCRYPATKDQRGKPCPACGTTLPMEDQKDEIWKISHLDTRFKEYRERTLPAVKYLFSLGLGETLDGEKSAEETFIQVVEAIERRLN
jgi:adenylate kinase